MDCQASMRRALRALAAGAIAAAGTLMLTAVANPAAGALITSWNSVSGNWNQAALWNPNGVPQNAGDQASDTLRGSQLTLDSTQNLNPTLQALTINGTMTTLVTFNGVTVTMNGPANLQSGRVTLQNMTFNGPGTVTNSIPGSVGGMTCNGTVTISTTFVNSGETDIVGIGAQNGNPAMPANLIVPAFTNTGTLNLTQTVGQADSTVTVTGDSPLLTNSGTIILAAGAGASGTRTISSDFTNTGTVIVGSANAPVPAAQIGGLMVTVNNNNSGTITINKGSTLSINTTTAYNVVLGFVNKQGGFIGGSGTLNVKNTAYYPRGGKVAPGVTVTPTQNFQVTPDDGGDSPGPGILHWVGNYGCDSAGTLAIQLGGNSIDVPDDTTTYDQLSITQGSCALAGGTLDLSLINGFTPSPTDVFDVVTADQGVFGSFANATSTVLTDDGTGMFDVTYVPGDGTPANPGVVELSDYQALPEPTSLGLICGLALLCRRPTHRRGFEGEARAA